MHVVATAGHVDHGKSTLVRALTGIDPDRFAEEKARGLTIDLGFAWTVMPSGAEVGFVDVPGHVRFLKNMLAGVGAVDACLFVVAATEGWKPQSEEHLRILELLGVGYGIIALTKAALVDADTLELARMEITERTAGTFLANAEIVAVDPPADAGMHELLRGLDTLLSATPPATDRDRPRLWVDRSFAAQGAGTVVTGTLTGGTLRVDDEVDVVRVSVGGGTRRARVRGLQSHKSALGEAAPGRRLAANLSGLAHTEVSRGDAVVLPGQWAPTRTFDASLTVLASLDHDVSRRGAYAIYIGSGEHRARIRVLGSEELPPGAKGNVRVHIPVELPLLPGDRYVLRESGRGETVGGGEVLDVDPVRPASKAAPSRSVDRVVAERGWIEATRLELLTGERRRPSVGTWVVDPAVLSGRQKALRNAVEAAGGRGHELAGMSELDRAVAASMPELIVDGGRARLATSEAEDLTGHPYLAALDAAAYSPPTPDEAGADRAEVRELVRRGLIVERDGFYFSPKAVMSAGAAIAELLAASPDGVTVAQIRDALGTTRKYLLPLLAHLDATGVTRRRADLRIPGPRLRG